MSGIFNHDGTPFKPPTLPEYDAYMNSIVCDKGGFGYHCMYCSKCIHGDYFEPSPELKTILNKQAQMTEEYAYQHNPNGLNDVLIQVNVNAE